MEDEMVKRKGANIEDKMNRGPWTADGEPRTADHGGGGDTMGLVRILPLHVIGGYGKAGDVVEMPMELARVYERDGYVEILGNEQDQDNEVSYEFDKRG